MVLNSVYEYEGVGESERTKLGSQLESFLAEGLKVTSSWRKNKGFETRQMRHLPQ